MSAVKLIVLLGIGVCWCLSMIRVCWGARIGRVADWRMICGRAGLLDHVAKN